MAERAHFVETSDPGRPCSTCRGYGLWAIGDPSPMGRMDAGGGMPTQPCPECGADANPLPEEME